MTELKLFHDAATLKEVEKVGDNYLIQQDGVDGGDTSPVLHTKFLKNVGTSNALRVEVFGSDYTYSADGETFTSSIKIDVIYPNTVVPIYIRAVSSDEMSITYYS
jgi:hypothetical protein